MQQRKPSIPLKHGAHLILNHALRCSCQVCERLLKWEDFDNVGVMFAICCKKTYKLKVWTVKVTVEDIEEEILLPPHREGFFPIDIDILDYGTEVKPGHDPSP